MNLLRFFFILLLPVLLSGCGASKNAAANKKSLQVITESHHISAGTQQLIPGIAAYRDSRFNYQRNGKNVLSVYLKEPVVVSVAARPEKWGYFQFPGILRRADNTIGIKWNLTIDAIEAYGSSKFGSAVSHDEGSSWQPAEVPEDAGNLLLNNGDRINVVTPTPVKVTDLQLPAPVGKGNDPYAKTSYIFYKLHDLPGSRQGVYMERLKKESITWEKEKASLYDPRAARYSFRGLVPVLWWGDMHVAKDQSIIAGIYPGFYIKDNGEADPHSGIFFYRSADNGYSWKIQGRILFEPDLNLDSTGYKRSGFSEPAFEVMADGSFLAVMRTTDGIGNGPLYASRSTDLGISWTKPAIIAPSGVLPRLLQLHNGVTVLASGRPGVQLRFSTDGYGTIWSDPFELLPYKNEKDEVSCGYTGLIATGPDRFLIVYSDFKYGNEAKEIRKAIKVREVIVQPG
ncbi:MAG TPA: sialidase family protein [Chitinophagaceae bacterium]|nr:sialidase family protein [Chitinophagaceae bacterium]